MCAAYAHVIPSDMTKEKSWHCNAGDVWCLGIEADHHSNYRTVFCCITCTWGCVCGVAAWVRTWAVADGAEGKPGLEMRWAGPAELPSVYEPERKWTKLNHTVEWRKPLEIMIQLWLHGKGLGLVAATLYNKRSAIPILQKPKWPKVLHNAAVKSYWGRSYLIF